MRDSTLWMAVFAATLVACETPEQVPLPSSTQLMAERLRQIARNRDPVSNTYLNDLRVGYLSGLEEPLDPLARLRARILLAREHLRAGQTQAAIDEFHQLQPEIEQRQVRMQPSLDLLHRNRLYALGRAGQLPRRSYDGLVSFPHRSRRCPRRPAGLADGPGPLYRRAGAEP